METQSTDKLSGYRKPDDEFFRERGLGPWISRNTSLLMRLGLAAIFTLCATSVALPNLLYGFQDDPTVITAAQLNSGNLPPGLEQGDYVEVRGTPDLGRPETGPSGGAIYGTPESRIAVASRYTSANYFYFRLDETGDNFLVQKAQTPPDLQNPPTVFRGTLATVNTVIFHDTTQLGLKQANMPNDESIPVVESSDTPEFYRELAPIYLLVVSLSPLSILYLLWRKNKPFLD